MREENLPDPARLPDDPILLKQIIASLLEVIRQQSARIHKLEHELDQLKRMHFGPRSERLVPEQMLMPFANQAFPAQLPPPAPPRDRANGGKGGAGGSADDEKGHGRQKLPDHLKRVEVLHDVAEDEKRCPCCGKKRVRIGQEESEQLEYTPSQLKVLKHVRPKYVCPDECEDSGVAVAPPPAGPIAKGLPGPGMLAYVCVAKFDDHLPAYRQQEMLARQGVHVARQTLCDWIAAAAEVLLPLLLLMKKRLLASKKIHTDDVPVPFLDPPHEHTRQGRLWVYLGDDVRPYVIFEFSPTHAEVYPLEFLKDYRGFLQCDAYVGYDKVLATVVGCWAHARRYFFDAQSTDPERAGVALGYIRQLYQVEERAAQKTPAERLALRQELSKPAAEAFRKWLGQEELSVLPESAMGEAFTYARNQWARLVRYLEDGELDIDNNVSERANRNVAIGRKNWLFAGSEEGGHRAAAIYSAIESAKRSGVEPLAYLTDLFQRLPGHPELLEEFLPDRWKQKHPPDTS